MELQLEIIGSLLIFLAIIHVAFPKYFNWKKELPSISLINRQMLRFHTFFIALTLMLMGLLCLTSSNELIETTLGKRLALGLGIFWVARLFVQFFGYSSKLWKGKVFETAIHIIFSLAWAYFSIVFISVYRMGK